MKTRIVRNLVALVFALSLSMGTAEYCNAQTTDKNADAALELIVFSVNKQLPKDYGNGRVNTKFVREGNYVIYYFVCDESKVDIDRMPMYRNVFKEELNANDFFLSELRKACKNAGVGIGYYYIGKTSGKIAKILIPAKELK